MIVIALTMALFALGLTAVIAKRNLLKKIIGLNIVNTAVIILFVYLGSEGAQTAPILIGEPGAIADPLPQALMLTAIVIGVSLTALGLGLVYRLYLRHRSLDIRAIEDAQRSADE